MNKRPTLILKYWLWPATLVVGIVVLLLTPGGFVEKVNFLLHGLCAQNHDHTHEIGGELLPFDARCAGIYSGTSLTLVILAVKNRLFALQLPKAKYLVVLVGFGAITAADGINSFLTDLGWWHPWESTNISRVITGYGTGIAMAIALVWLVAGTVFQLGDRQPAARSWRDIAWFMAPMPLMLVVLESGWSWLYAPISIFLVVGAWVVLGMLALVTILLATKIDERIGRIHQLHVPGAIGLIVGMAVMLLLALGRSWLETKFGIPSTL